MLCVDRDVKLQEKEMGEGAGRYGLESDILYIVLKNVICRMNILNLYICTYKLSKKRLNKNEGIVINVSFFD